MWLAMVGSERIDETHDPELAIDRALMTYLQKGYSKEWINQRLKSIEVRKELTDEWNRVGISKQEDLFARHIALGGNFPDHFFTFLGWRE